jgi:shikimate 5-dehydrogenase
MRYITKEVLFATRHGTIEGHSPLGAASIPGGAFVYDLVYNPADTPLLIAAQEAGAKTLGGLAMLVYQGAKAFELWTGKKAPLPAMFDAARQALA